MVSSAHTQRRRLSKFVATIAVSLCAIFGSLGTAGSDGNNASPVANDATVHAILDKLAARLVLSQQTKFDENIYHIVATYHLDDAKALAKLAPQEARDKLKWAVLDLLGSARSDPLADHLAKELGLSYSFSPTQPIPPTN